jgi:hypothetical protein
MSKALKITIGSLFAISTALAVAAYSINNDLVADEIESTGFTTFADVDDFKRNAARKILIDPKQHTIVDTAHSLSLMRVNSQFAVCSDQDEIESAQYVALAEVVDPITEFAGEVGNEIDLILFANQGITDCQFRIIEATAIQAAESYGNGASDEGNRFVWKTFDYQYGQGNYRQGEFAVKGHLTACCAWWSQWLK